MHLSVGQLKIVLILALVLNMKIKPLRQIFSEHLDQDMQSCTACFEKQIQECKEFFVSIEEPSELTRLLKGIALMFDRRQIYSLQLKELNLVSKRGVLKPHTQSLKWNPGGFQLCQSTRFVDYLKQQRGYASSTIWFYMKNYVSPLLMRELDAYQFPVPQSYKVCGLNHFQAFAGHTLTHYAKADRELRLKLSQQLLQLALQLTEGFQHFRIFLTDFTADNFAFDETKQQIVIIDVDTVILVDALDQPRVFTKYEELPGEGFTYDVEKLCKHQHLDINVYQACSLIRDYVLSDLEMELLESCVLCAGDCPNRFQLAFDLMELMEQLKN